MSVLFVILPLAFILAGCAVVAFAYAVRQGQFDDLDTPSHRMLFDDDEPAASPTPDPARGPHPL